MGYFITKRYCLVLSMLIGFLLTGCGTTLKRDATSQLLLSDAVDQAVAEIDFSDLAGKKVFFETRYIDHVKGLGFVNSDYITSSLRQQMIAADLHLQEDLKEADYIVEARVGALGANSHDITYGIPQSTSFNTAISTASSLFPGVPAVPSLPEISFAKKNDQMGAVKVGAFAYSRVTGKPVWQSGIKTSRSTAKDTWIFGVGPFQNGTIYDGTKFAGATIGFPLQRNQQEEKSHPDVDYKKEHHFKHHSPQSQLSKNKVNSEKKQTQLQKISASIQQLNKNKVPALQKKKNRPLDIKWDDSTINPFSRNQE